ncbi:MAG: phosphatidylglycerophosphatase A [Polyangiaceae bacterium]|nr:phosphatidylglycerophosphatase A [Polyangiaceae bacterium]
MASIATIPAYVVLREVGPGAVAAAAALVTAAGIWSADRMARATVCEDPQFVVVDEAAGVLLAWVAAPPTWQGLLAGLVLFRLLDITKPFPCRACERARPAGLGIMLDDLCAGLIGAAALLGAQALGLLSSE